LSSLVEADVAILYKIHSTQLIGSCFVMGLLFFGVFEALFCQLSRNVAFITFYKAFKFVYGYVELW
jgi:hypothetical protein